ncbi:hypothetical protein [Singulisphaera sp. PoT]|uniref:hypothetical protein n=1 Tax=Singulisphaera sp. PoT TaxID=3411797 RepID=UPI003BF560FA
MTDPSTSEAPSLPIPLAGIIAELRRLIERPDSSLYPGYGKPRVDYISVRNLAEVVDRLEASARALEVANHTYEVVIRSKISRIARGAQLCSRLNADLEEAWGKLRVARHEFKELEHSRGWWVELAEWAAAQYALLKADVDRLNLELMHSRKVAEWRGDCLESYAAAINDQALKIHELEERVEDLQLHPDRASAAPRKPTLIQRIRKLLHP